MSLLDTLISAKIKAKLDKADSDKEVAANVAAAVSGAKNLSKITGDSTIEQNINAMLFEDLGDGKVKEIKQTTESSKGLLGMVQSGSELVAKMRAEQANIPVEVEKATALGKVSTQQDIEKKIAEKNITKMELNRELQDFFLVDNNIPRTDAGLIGRTMQGLQNVASSFDQSTAQGFSAAAHDALKKRLRVKLVRAAGDVGNINIVEQKAAEQIIPGFFDAKGTANLKRAFLSRTAEAISTQEGPELESSIKTILNEFAKSDAFTGPKGKEAEKLSKKYKVGDIIEHGKNKYKVTDATNPFDPDMELVTNA